LGECTDGQESEYVDGLRQDSKKNEVMKQLIVILGFTTSIQVSAQTFSEWFFQNKTQIKYLHTQIAALVVFVRDLDHGYSIVQAGTDLIGGLQQADQDQHREYFASLMEAKPAVVNDPRVTSIRNWAVEIEGVTKTCLSISNNELWLSQDERTLIANTAKSLRQDVADFLGLLEKLLRNGYWEMTDAGRLARIDGVYLAMQNRLRSAIAFQNLVDQLVSGRERDWEDAKKLKSLYDKKS
jgi:hypothetical protein